ncbi:MAG TPA: DUF1345 domain-containing protein [Acidimicrobiales bacterium]|nr:DUF1345 domain-containing protein [Acidimicrobiales bacterium]
MARLTVAFTIGFVFGIATSFFGPWALAVLIGWDVFSLIFLVGIWFIVWPMDADSTTRHSQLEDPSRALADGAVLMAAVASLGGVGFILLKAAHANGGTKGFFLGVGILSVIFAWAAVHSVFTLRYAAAYYLEPVGGVDYNQDESPCYADFAYLAFTIGMTFQVSDTNLTIGTIRRLALRHALLSYLFGAVIIGLVINVVASLLK